MKNWLIIIVLGCVSIGIFGARHASSAVVNDTKSIPGTACRYAGASYLVNPDLYGVSYATPCAAGCGTQLYGPQWQNPLQGTPATNSWSAFCPLVRDNVSDPNGITTAVVDIADFTRAGSTADSAVEECWIVECNRFGQCASGTHNRLTWPRNTYTFMTLQPPAPPSSTWTNGSAAVVCTLSFWAQLDQVRYAETGGNSNDW